MNLEPIYETTTWDHGFAPIARGLGEVRVLRHEAPCPRCTEVGASGYLCDPCAGEVATNRAEARDEIVATLYTGHGLGHTYRADIA